MSVEVLIKCHAHCPFLSSPRKNCRIVRFLHPDAGDMTCFESQRPEDFRGTWGEALVQQNPFHAT